MHINGGITDLKLWTNAYHRTYYEPNFSFVWNVGVLKKSHSVILTLRSSARAGTLLNMAFNRHLTKYKPKSSIENDLEN